MTHLVLVVLVTALTALLGNRLLFRLYDRWSVVTLVPWWEELCKGLALWVLPGYHALPVHLLFGLLELGYSTWRGERFLGLVGFSVHGLVGGVVGLLLGGGPEPGARTLGLAVLAAGLLHMLLNLAVLGLVFPTLGLKGLSCNLHVDPGPGGRYNEHE
ncbi:MAG: hypothetical protein ACOY93_19785 [Bacillota bacterium]